MLYSIMQRLQKKITNTTFESKAINNGYFIYQNFPLNPTRDRPSVAHSLAQPQSSEDSNRKPITASCGNGFLTNLTSGGTTGYGKAEDS